MTFEPLKNNLEIKEKVEGLKKDLEEIKKRHENRKNYFISYILVSKLIDKWFEDVI